MSEMCGTTSMSARATRYATSGLLLATLAATGPALAAGAVTHCPSVGIHAHQDGTYPFENRVGELAWIKSQPHYNYKANEKKLTKMYFTKSYNDTQANEFKIHDLMASCVKQIKKAVKNLKTPVAFHINTKTSVGKYDFKKKGFPFKPYSTTTVYPMPVRVQTTGPGDPYNRFEVKITNPKLVRMIKMPEKKAEKWIDGRSNNGYVNRTVYLHGRVVSTGDFTHQQGRVAHMYTQFLMNTRLAHVRVDSSNKGHTLATYKASAKGQSNG